MCQAVLAGCRVSIVGPRRPSGLPARTVAAYLFRRSYLFRLSLPLFLLSPTYLFAPLASLYLFYLYLPLLPLLSLLPLFLPTSFILFYLFYLCTSLYISVLTAILVLLSTTQYYSVHLFISRCF